jgi:hypothetical protein
MLNYYISGPAPEPQVELQPQTPPQTAPINPAATTTLPVATTSTALPTSPVVTGATSTPRVTVDKNSLTASSSSITLSGSSTYSGPLYVAIIQDKYSGLTDGSSVVAALVEYSQGKSSVAGKGDVTDAANGRWSVTLGKTPTVPKGTYKMYVYYAATASAPPPSQVPLASAVLVLN